MMERIEVVRILQIAHRGKGDIDNAVYVGVSLLYFGAQNADNFKAETIKPDVFPQRVTSRKQFLFGFRTDHRYTGVLVLIFHVVKTARAQFEGANRNYIRIIPAHRERKDPGVVLDVNLFLDFRRDMRNLGKVGGERLDIVLSEADLNSRFLAAGLHGCFSRHHDGQLRTEIRKNIRESLAKTIAIGQQHDDRCDSPTHAQHGESCAAPIVTHGVVGLVEQITEHHITPAAALQPAAAWPLCAPDRDPRSLQPATDRQLPAWPTAAPIWADRIPVAPALLPLPPSSPPPGTYQSVRSQA